MIHVPSVDDYEGDMHEKLIKAYVRCQNLIVKMAIIMECAAKHMGNSEVDNVITKEMLQQFLEEHQEQKEETV